MRPRRDCGHDHRSGARADVGCRRRRAAPAPSRLVLDVPAGPVRAVATTATVDGRTRVADVAFRNVPSFVLAAGGAAAARRAARFTADVAFGGAFYAIVDAEAAGLVDRRGASCRN